MDARSHDLGVGSEIPLKLSYVTSAGDIRIFTGTGIIHSNSYIESSHPLHQIILENVSFPDLPVISNATLAIKPQSEQIYMNCPEIKEGIQQILYIKLCINTEETVYTPIDDRFISTDIARTADIPNKTSQLTNDSNFVTSEAIPTNYVTTDTEQTITGKKTFNEKVAFGDENGEGGLLYGHVLSAPGDISMTLASGKNADNSYESSIILQSSNGSYESGLGPTVFFKGDLKPLRNTDIGSYNKQIKDLYISGNLTDGPNKISVANIASKSEIKTKTSQLTNDSGFITSSALTGYTTEQRVQEMIDASIGTAIGGTY